GGDGKPDDGPEGRRDLPLADLAVAPSGEAPPRRPRADARPGRRRARARLRRGARALRRAHPRGGLRGVPHDPRLRAADDARADAHVLVARSNSAAWPWPTPTQSVASP